MLKKKLSKPKTYRAIYTAVVLFNNSLKKKYESIVSCHHM